MEATQGEAAGASVEALPDSEEANVVAEMGTEGFLVVMAQEGVVPKEAGSEVAPPGVTRICVTCQSTCRCTLNPNRKSKAHTPMRLPCGCECRNTTLPADWNKTNESRRPTMTIGNLTIDNARSHHRNRFR